MKRVLIMFAGAVLLCMLVGCIDYRVNDRPSENTMWVSENPQAWFIISENSKFKVRYSEQQCGAIYINGKWNSYVPVNFFVSRVDFSAMEQWEENNTEYAEEGFSGNWKRKLNGTFTVQIFDEYQNFFGEELKTLKYHAFPAITNYRYTAESSDITFTLYNDYTASIHYADGTEVECDAWQEYYSLILEVSEEDKYVFTRDGTSLVYDADNSSGDLFEEGDIFIQGEKIE